VWLLLAIGVVGALVLLYRSGVPFVRRFLSWHVEDRRMVWQLYRDVFWFRRPKSLGRREADSGGAAAT
jgi:hypothetical protein